MPTIIHTLTATETACGVTLEQVATELPRALLIPGGVMLSKGLPPALADSVARCALGGAPRFSHLSHGYPVYTH